MEGSKENQHRDLGIVGVNVNFQPLNLVLNKFQTVTKPK